MSSDPQQPSWTLHTGRQGVAGKVGHDLVLGVGAWSATVTVDGQTVTGVVVHADTASITVLEGHGGAKPLSDKDKVKIAEEAAKTLGGSPLDLTATGESGSLVGTVSFHGTTQPFTMPFEVHVGDTTADVRGQGELVQSAFGIKPYSAMLGALKVRDMVEVRFAATVEL